MKQLKLMVLTLTLLMGTMFTSCMDSGVIVGFTVNEDGTLSDIKVMKSISPTFDEEAIRVVQALDVIEQHSDLYEVYCLTANNRVT